MRFAALPLSPRSVSRPRDNAIGAGQDASSAESDVDSSMKNSLTYGHRRRKIAAGGGPAVRISLPPPPSQAEGILQLPGETHGAGRKWLPTGCCSNLGGNRARRLFTGDGEIIASSASQTRVAEPDRPEIREARSGILEQLGGLPPPCLKPVNSCAKRRKRWGSCCCPFKIIQALPPHTAFLQPATPIWGALAEPGTSRALPIGSLIRGNPSSI